MSESPPVPTKRKSIGSLLLRVGISAVIIGWLATRMDWQHVLAAFRVMNWGLWAAAVGLYVFCQLICSVRWMWLSRPMGFNQSLGRFTAVYFVGMFFNLFLPTSVGGDAVRAVYLAKDSGKKMNALLSVLLDRASGLVVLIALACTAAALSPVPIPPQLKLPIWGIGAAAAIGLIALPWIAQLVALIHLPGTGNLSKIAAKLRRLGEETHAAVVLFRARPDVLAGTTAISIVNQLLNAVVVWLIGIAMGLQIPPIYYCVAVPMVVFLTLIPLSLNGVGIREGGMILFLQPAGVRSEDAVTLAFLWFLAQTTTSLLGAAVYLIGHFKPPEGENGEPPPLDHRPRQGRTGKHMSIA